MVEDRFTELLAQKLSGEITLNESEEFDRLLAGSAHYRHEYATLQQYWQDDEQPADNAAAVFEKILQRTDIREHADNKQDNIRRLKPRTYWLRGAAAVIIGAIAAVFIYVKAHNSSADAVVALKQFNTPAGTLSHLTLSDGTQITLNAESTVKYPAEFNSKTREVYLSGEAYFDVQHDPSHPFIVHTSRSDIRVLGTAFNIKCYDNDSLFAATLLRGSIQASVKNKANNTVLLKPLDKLVISNTGFYLSKVSHLDADTVNIETAWMRNKLVFKDQPFGLLANDLSRKYGINIIFGNKDLKGVKLNGEYDRENISQVLASLKRVAEFNYRMTGKQIYIY